jgi:hypothetical protein
MTVRPLFAQQTAPQNEVEKAEVYLNLGYTNDKGEFINLPFGLGIDNMRELKPGTGQNAEFNALRKQQNDLLAAVKAFIADIPPGQDKPITLEVRARRRQEPAAPAATPSVDLLKMLAGGEVPNPITFT